MATVGLVGHVDPTPGAPKTALLTADTIVSEGPAPGAINIPLVFTYSLYPWAAPPNVFVTTGNPHWTGHVLSATNTEAQLLLHRKTPSPGGRTFRVNALAMGLLVPGAFPDSKGGALAELRAAE